MNQNLNLSTSFLLIIIMSPLMAMSSKSLLMIWILLELNNMAFIYLFTTKNMTTQYTALNFFILQTLSSITIIIFITMNHKSTQELMEMEMNFLLMMGLMLKMALPPFHSWMIKLSKMTSWNMIIVFMTWQKMIPIFIMMKFQHLLYSVIFMMMLLMGTLLQLMMVKIKPLMISSSIVHMSWMMIPHNTYKTFPLMYLMTYTLIIYPLIKIFKKTNKWKLMKEEKKNNFIKVAMMLNLSSIPPLMGFILKWTVISIMINQKTNIMYMMMLFIASTISFYIYFQMAYFTMMKTKMKSKTKINHPMKLNLPSIIMILAIPMIMII